MSSLVAEHFRLWLRAGLTGCEFARALAGRGRNVAIFEDDGNGVGKISAVFDGAASNGSVAIVMFPHIRSERGLVALLNTLAAQPRWKIAVRAKPSTAGDVLVGVEWTTASGDVSDAMGFAPFASMPVPRRAPYVALATWPGERANPFRGEGRTPRARDGVVSFLDASHGFARAEYDERWTKTGQRVAALMSAPPDDAALYRRAAFALSREAAAALQPS